MRLPTTLTVFQHGLLVSLASASVIHREPSVSGTNDGGVSLPRDFIEDVCKYPFDVEDPEKLSLTWISSGAMEWFLNFLNENGADKWSDKFFKKVIAGGTQGGSTYDCNHMNSGQCPGPLNNLCEDYSPPMAFYVHLQMGNLYTAYQRLWAGMITDGIQELSSGIKDIVDTYGTPPKDNYAAILSFFVGVMSSLVGIGGEIDSKNPGKGLGKFANPLTFAAGLLTQMSADTNNWDTIDPEELNDKLEQAYGQMFEGVMDGLNDTATRIFEGTLPEGWGKEISAEEWVWTQFADGAWLNKDYVGELVDAYVENVKTKFVCSQNTFELHSLKIPLPPLLLLLLATLTAHDRKSLRL